MSQIPYGQPGSYYWLYAFPAGLNRRSYGIWRFQVNGMTP